jgi:hypothetical protein
MHCLTGIDLRLQCRHRLLKQQLLELTLVELVLLEAAPAVITVQQTPKRVVAEKRTKLAVLAVAVEAVARKPQARCCSSSRT